MQFSQTDAASEWLSQISDPDRDTAASLLDSMMLVGMEPLIASIRALIISHSKSIDGPVGLYVERKMSRNPGGIVPLFIEEKTTDGRLRAVGRGPSPIVPESIDPEVGSEGILAWLITELCREQPNKFVSHPGPDQIRSLRVRCFLLLTDFIGSGKRAHDYLSAAWTVKSVRSWHSGHQLTFAVVAYSGTLTGIKRVDGHPSTPKISIVAPAPTIDSEFGSQAAKYKALCKKYDPVGRPGKLSLGFAGTGALIAFSHGCPNNAPRFLYRESASWKPLFGGRVTARSRAYFSARQATPARDAERLVKLGETKLADSPWLSRVNAEGRLLLVLLSALKRRPRFDIALSQRTGFSIPEISAAVALAQRLDA
jgi:hypothetical protein